MMMTIFLGTLSVKKISEAENIVVLGMNNKTELVLGLSEELLDLYQSTKTHAF